MRRQPYDEVAEVTLPPMQELLLSVVLGPTALFVVGISFFLAGLFAPVEMARYGVCRIHATADAAAGVPWVLFTVLVWPLFMWFRLRGTFTLLVRHLLRRVRRNDFRAFVHPLAAMVAAARAQGLSVSYQHRGLLWHIVGIERMAQPARLDPS